MPRKAKPNNSEDELNPDAVADSVVDTTKSEPKATSVPTEVASGKRLIFARASPRYLSAQGGLWVLGCFITTGQWHRLEVSEKAFFELEENILVDVATDDIPPGPVAAETKVGTRKWPHLETATPVTSDPEGFFDDDEDDEDDGDESEDPIFAEVARRNEASGGSRGDVGNTGAGIPEEDLDEILKEDKPTN